MKDGLDRVTRTLAQAEDVDMPEGFAADAPDIEPGFDGIDLGPPPPPIEEGEAPPPEARCVDFPLNDYGNGLRVVEHFGPDLLEVARVGFFSWDGRRFAPDPDGILVRRLCHRMTDLIARETWHMTLPAEEEEILMEAEGLATELETLGVIKPKDRTDDQIARAAHAERMLARAKLIKEKRDKAIGRRLTHAKNAGNTNGIKNMMTEAAAILSRPLEDLDADPLVINTETAVLRFWTVPGEDDGGMNPPRPAPRMEALPHDRAQLLTKLMPVAYDPQASCPGFIAFLERIMPAAEMRRFLRRWFGYGMTGLTTEQVFAFFYGSGANGKSALVDLIAKIIGDYAASAKIESITGQTRRGGGDATPDLVPLIGARFVRTSEPDQGQQLQEGLVKELTGGEPILIRALNQNFVQVYPIFKLTISGNHKPEIRGGDDGIWRRVLLVPFEVQISAEERDPHLVARLFETERAGILNWLIGGLMEYLEHGLMVPETVRAATAEYREDSDPIAACLAAVFAVTGNPEHSMRAKDVQQAIQLWLDETGRGAWKPRTIFNNLKAKQGRWRSPTTGQTFTKRKASDAYYDGIALLEPFKSQYEEYKARVEMADMRRQSGGLL